MDDQTIRLLVVDDEPWMCKGIQKIVEKYCPRFSVTSIAHDGQQALDLLKQHEYDLVLTDICMPNVNGLDLILQMKEQGLSTPVVIITGHNEFEYARTALRYGVLDYISKPIHKELIREVLDRLYDEHALGTVEEREPTALIEHVEKGKDLVHFVMEQAKHHYDQDISLAFIAEEAGFNSSYLSRLFKMETGLGFVKYLTIIRIERAKALLGDTDWRVEKIAKEVGYWDKNHFSKTFKRETGKTPIEYRSNPE